jgi:hypothetical protein
MHAVVFIGCWTGGEDRGAFGVQERAGARAVSSKFLAQAASGGCARAGTSERRQAQVTAWLRKLDGAFDGAAGIAGGAVGAAGCWRRSDQAHYVEQAFWFEGLGHADDGAELVAGGVVGGLR